MKSNRVSRFEDLKKRQYALSMDFAKLQAQLIEVQNHVQRGADMHGISVAINRALVLMVMDKTGIDIPGLNRYLTEADILIANQLPLNARIPEDVITKRMEEIEKRAKEAEEKRKAATEAQKKDDATTEPSEETPESPLPSESEGEPSDTQAEIE